MKEFKLYFLLAFTFSGMLFAQVKSTKSKKKNIIKTEIASNKEELQENAEMYSVLDEKADYIDGGISGFRIALQNHFDVTEVDRFLGLPSDLLLAKEKIDTKLKSTSVDNLTEEEKEILEKIQTMTETLYSEVVFTVNTDGSISSIKAYGGNPSLNKEYENAVRKVKGKWKPAKYKGKFIKSRLRLPIKVKNTL